MDSREILSRSQKIGNRDFEKNERRKSDSIAVALGGLFSGVLILVELVFSKSLNFGLFASFAVMIAIQQTVDYIQEKKKRNLLYAIFLYAIGLLFLLLFIHNVMNGRVS